MYGVWWKVLWSGIWLIVLMVNLAFAFNVVNIVNPTSLDMDYSNYYFGMSSFIDCFKTWFGENDFLNGFMGALRKLGNFISKIYSAYNTAWSSIGKLANWNPDVVEVIAGIIALVSFTVRIVPMVLMVLMGLLYITYILFFAIQIILFVIAFFGGSFATEMPSVYPELDEPIPNIISNLRAIMV